MTTIIVAMALAMKAAMKAVVKELLMAMEDVVEVVHVDVAAEGDVVDQEAELDVHINEPIRGHKVQAIKGYINNTILYYKKYTVSWCAGMIWAELCMINPPLYVICLHVCVIMFEWLVYTLVKSIEWKGRCLCLCGLIYLCTNQLESVGMSSLLEKNNLSVPLWG